MDLINEIFDNMDKWRHLPSYQLERRADAFFAVYMGTLLERKYDIEVEGLVPEFPVRIGSIDPDSDSNQSFKIDYLAKAGGVDKVFFVELKTDPRSRRSEQDWYLERAQEVGMVNLLKGVWKIYRATSAKRKYRALFAELEILGFMQVDEDGKYKPFQKKYEVQIVYVQPHNVEGDANVLSFHEAADIIAQKGDPISTRFAKSLLLWAEQKAGDR